MSKHSQHLFEKSSSFAGWLQHKFWATIESTSWSSFLSAANADQVVIAFFLLCWPLLIYVVAWKVNISQQCI